MAHKEETEAQQGAAGRNTEERQNASLAGPAGGVEAGFGNDRSQELLSSSLIASAEVCEREEGFAKELGNMCGADRAAAAERLVKGGTIKFQANSILLFTFGSLGARLR